MSFGFQLLRHKALAALSRASLSLRVIRYGPYQPDLLVPHRSVLFEMQKAGVKASPSSDQLVEILAESVGWTRPQETEADLVDPQDIPVRRDYPDYFDTEEQTVRLLRLLVLCIQPGYVVETGVANGVSTCAILSALRQNKHGQLISFDVDSPTTGVIPKALSEGRWKLELLNPSPSTQDLARRVQPYSGDISLWYHDSDHTYSWQLSEFRLARSVLSRPGILVADDVDGNGAFAQFVKESDLQAWLIFENRKCSGLALLT